MSTSFLQGRRKRPVAPHRIATPIRSLAEALVLRTAPFGFAAVLASAGFGCVDTDAAVFVEAEVADPSLTVSGSALGTSLTGRFDVRLHLAARASETSEVTFESFALKSAEGGAVILETLPVSAAPSGAVEVDPGSDSDVKFTIDTGAATLPAELKDQLCASDIVVSIVFRDSLDEGTSSVDSGAFRVSGC